MDRQHILAVAQELHLSRPGSNQVRMDRWRKRVNEVAREFASDGKWFDHTLFYRACGMLNGTARQLNTSR